MAKKHLIQLNKAIEFNVLVNGEPRTKTWNKGRVLEAAVRSRSVERFRADENEAEWVEIADVVVFDNDRPVIVLPSIPCEYFSFLDGAEDESKLDG